MWRYSRRQLGLQVLGLCILATAVLCGCARQEMAEVADISVVNYRYIIDERSSIVRVVGEVRNGTELPAPEAEIVATLHSRTGSQKGQNRVGIPGLEAGETHQFALAVTSHGALKRLDLTLVEPGTILGEEDEDAEEDDGESDGDGG